MTVELKKTLLRLHSLFHLRLVHAAIGSYPVESKNAALAVNRMLMVFENSDREESFIRDLSSGKVMPMRAGSLYFIPCEHKIDTTLSDTLFFVSFQFNLDLFYGFDVFRNYGKCVTIENPSLIAEARQLIHQEDEIRSLCRVNEIIFNLCVGLLTDCPVMIERKKDQWRRYEKVLDFVQNSGDATTTVATLSEMCGMRQDVFSRKFSHDMGVTPKAFIANTLMRKATEILLTSGANVRMVAETLNFSSEYYFSRFFKKHTGVSPRLFRRMHGGP